MLVCDYLFLVVFFLGLVIRRVFWSFGEQG